MIELNDDFPTTHVWWHRRVVKSDQISCGSTESQKNLVCQWVQVLTHALVFSCIFRRQEMPRTPLRISSSRFSCVSVRISFQIPNMNTMDDMFGIYPPKFWLYRNVPILFGSYVCCPYHLSIFDMNIHRMSMSHNSTNGMSTTKNANICDFCYWTLNINILIGSTMLNLHLFFCIGQIVSMPPELLYISHILPEYFLHGLVWNAEGTPKLCGPSSFSGSNHPFWGLIPLLDKPRSYKHGCSISAFDHHFIPILSPCMISSMIKSTASFLHCHHIPTKMIGAHRSKLVTKFWLP